MTARDLYAVGAKLLGLYLVIHGLLSLLGLAQTYEAALNSKASDPLGYATVAAAQALLLAVIGLFLFLRNRPSNVASVVAPTQAELLLVGLQLLGVYFATAGVIGVLHSIADTVVVSASWTLHLTDIASATAFAGIGLLFAFRAPSVVRVVYPAAA